MQLIIWKNRKNSKTI